MRQRPDRAIENGLRMNVVAERRVTSLLRMARRISRLSGSQRSRLVMTHSPAPRRKRVVIVGAGFSGVAAAEGLAHLPVDVTLVDQHDYHTFQPLIYQVATALLNAEDVGREVARSVPAPGQPQRPHGNGHPHRLGGPPPGA